MSDLNRSVVEITPTNRRLEAFSDSVFAIVLTIMVFDIRIPSSLASLWARSAFQPLAAVFVTYILSFFVVVNLWTSHHYLVFTVSMPTRAMIWLNNFVLFCVTLVPIVTRFLGLHPDSSKAAAAYGFVGVAITASYMLLRTHVAQITDNEVHRGIHRRVLRLTWSFLAIYGVSIPLAFVSPWLAWACFLIVPALVVFLPGFAARQSGSLDPVGRALQRSCP